MTARNRGLSLLLAGFPMRSLPRPYPTVRATPGTPP